MNLLNGMNISNSTLVSGTWAIVIAVLGCSLSLSCPTNSFGQNTKESSPGKLMQVGVAQVDITPDKPIHLAAYNREGKSEGIGTRIHAQALAFGSDAEGPSVLITVDLIGVPRFMADRVTARLVDNAGLDSAQVVITAAHIHSGPDISTSPQQPVDELARINHYIDELTRKFEQVAIEALHGRQPSRVSWGQGEVGFAQDRRVIENGRYVDMGIMEVEEGGAVDQSLPLLRVADPDGNLRAVLVNYACHGTTLTGAYNKIHGDWIAEAQRIIEERHPGTTALITIGAAGNANPQPRGDVKYTTQHGRELADEVDRLLGTTLQPLTTPPVGRSTQIDLPFATVPTVYELVRGTEVDREIAYGNPAHRNPDFRRHAQHVLHKMAQGEDPPASRRNYPIKTWTFGDDLAMIFLGGEVVADYSLRLKRELGAQRLWVTAYSHGEGGYIPSERMLPEGGYEVYWSQIGRYSSRFARGIEDLIIGAVYDLLPGSYKPSFLTDTE